MLDLITDFAVTLFAKLSMIFDFVSDKILPSSVAAVWILSKVYRNLRTLPTGELMRSLDSPSKKYTVNIYSGEYKNNTITFVRGEVVFNERTPFGRKQGPKNIFWQIRQHSVNRLFWVDEETIMIDEIALNVNFDRYDCRSVSA